MTEWEGWDAHFEVTPQKTRKILAKIFAQILALLPCIILPTAASSYIWAQ